MIISPYIGNGERRSGRCSFANQNENEVKRMKELYLDAEMDVVKFSVEDVIATSVSEETTTEWQGMGGPNEGAPGDSFLE